MSAFVELNMEQTFCESGKLGMSFPVIVLILRNVFLYLSYKGQEGGRGDGGREGRRWDGGRGREGREGGREGGRERGAERERGRERESEREREGKRGREGRREADRQTNKKRAGDNLHVLNQLITSSV